MKKKSLATRFLHPFLLLGAMLVATSLRAQATRSGETVGKPYINIREAGAKGDGTTDDTAAFQGALDSLEKTGGTVFVPAGNYRITRRLLLSGDHASAKEPINNIELIGESQVACRLLGDGVDYIIGAKTVLGKDNKRIPIFGTLISRLTFANYDPQAGTAVGGIDASYMLRWTCRQSVFVGLKTGIYSMSQDQMTDESPDSMAIYIIRIQNNVFYGCMDYAIKMGRIFDLVIENNEIEHGVGGIAVGQPGDGFDAAANTIRIEDNLIEGLGPGAPAILGSCWIGGRIVGNYFEANYGGDIELIPKGSDGWVRAVTIASNTFQPTQEQRSANYGPIKITKAIDTVISGNFTTSTHLVHPESGPLGKGVNIFSNTLNNPAAIGDIKGAKSGNPSDYLGQLSNVSMSDAERVSVAGPVASVGMHAILGFRYAPHGEEGRSIAYATAPPQSTEIKHESGDILLNSKPSLSGVKKLLLGWVCVEAGTPGVWKPIIAGTE